jgi:hypothetical protein
LHQATTTVTRRATTAASKRQFKVGDVFTACYTAAFATAAILDAKHKDDRRQQWDRAIAEARGGPTGKKSNEHQHLDSDPEGRAEQDGIESHINLSRAQRLAQHTNIAIFSQVEKLLSSSAPLLSLRRELRYLHNENSSQLEGQLQLLESHLQESLSNELSNTEGELECLAEAESWRDTAPTSFAKTPKTRDARTSTHLRHMEDMVAGLVNALMLTSKGSGQPRHKESDTMTSVPSQTTNLDIFSARPALQPSRSRLPNYSLHSTSSFADRKGLNDSVASLLAQTRQQATDNIDLLVAKICYNLLISTAPPNIHTYNTLIIHFTKLKQNHLAQVVVDSFFNNSRFVPNNTTIAAILDHYAATGDEKGFKNVVRRMKGVDGDMRIRRRHISSLAQQPALQHIAANAKVTHRNGMLHWKVPRDSVIFKSLIAGSLKLFGVKRAVMYYKAALREGCKVPQSLFERLVKACLGDGDLKSGTTILSAILKRWRDAQDSAAHLDLLEKQLLFLIQEVMVDSGRLLEAAGKELSDILSSLRASQGTSEFSSMAKATANEVQIVKGAPRCLSSPPTHDLAAPPLLDRTRDQRLGNVVEEQSAISLSSQPFPPCLRLSGPWLVEGRELNFKNAL